MFLFLLCPTLNNRNVLQTSTHSDKATTKCSISKQLPMMLFRFWKTNSSTFLMNYNRKTNNIRPWKDDSSLTCKSMLLSVSTRLVMMLHRWKRTWWNTCFCLVWLKQDKGSEGHVTQRSRMSCQVIICEYVLIEGFARPANDVQVKRPWIFTYQIKNRDVFPPRNRLEVETMMWLVLDQISRM